ncbi:unnamed protein product [Heligmosomoides polygyrus]|uniref:Uncharacterized protein n=1 Tax=Heligmosomoides polygyrus TaxID=6339 RepID=A0A3P7X258_HELPZ|nr:unnamed protein product [Heligmosomoides polygyrus]
MIYALAWVLWHAVRVKTNFKGDKYIRADGRLDDEERVALSLGELYQQLYHRAARVWPLPQHCRGSLTSKNLTRQWTLEEGKPFYCGLSAQPLQEKDLRKMLERWRPHCRQSVKACSPEDRIKKYWICSHGNATRSSLQSIPDPGEYGSAAYRFWLHLGDIDYDREEAFREMQKARVDWSALIRKALSRALYSTSSLITSTKSNWLTTTTNHCCAFISGLFINRALYMAVCDHDAYLGYSGSTSRTE